MKLFLKLERWQLLRLMLTAPVSVIIIIGIILILNKTGAVSAGVSAGGLFLLLFLILSIFATPILFFYVFFGWLYTVGTNLNKKLPDTVQMDLEIFKWIIVIPIVFVLRLSSCIFDFPNIDWIYIFGKTYFFVYLLLYLVLIVCMIYCFYFVAKSLKAVEFQRPVSFRDYAVEFYSLLFFPIGIWVIQPRINEMFDETLQDEEYF